MSSETLKIICERRSIRQYSSQKVPEKFIRKILKASLSAPSAHNNQPWRFIVITDNELKRRLAIAMANEMDKALKTQKISAIQNEKLVNSSIKRFTSAPVIIISAVVFNHSKKSHNLSFKNLEYIMAVQSLAAAIQNMLLAIYSEGIGSCWYCAPLFCQKTVRKILKIPLNIEPQALITIGYPSNQPKEIKRKKFDEVVFRNFWGEIF